MFETPVLFIIFNRPDKAKKVFEVIRKIQPARLYIAADGPREIPGEQKKCEETRSTVLDYIDWDCEVKTLFQHKNLGCGLGPSTAISWLFENEEAGIILEDDCVPSESFFPFCQELLKKYENDPRIMHISGSNFQYGWQHHKDDSYYFSYFGHEWGWATWRRAWQLYDFEVKTYQQEEQRIRPLFTSFIERLYRLNKVKQTYYATEPVSWWDYQWEYCKLIHKGLSITPNRNLIVNTGFGDDATHTKSIKDIRSTRPQENISFPLKHPTQIQRDIVSDKRYFRNYFMKVILSRKILALLRLKGFDYKG